MSPHRHGPPHETPVERAARHRAQIEADLAILEAGGETGWNDNDGQPAHWPVDFFDHDTEWRQVTNPTPELAPGEQPF